MTQYFIKSRADIIQKKIRRSLSGKTTIPNTVVFLYKAHFLPVALFQIFKYSIKLTFEEDTLFAFCKKCNGQILSYVAQSFENKM